MLIDDAADPATSDSRSPPAARVPRLAMPTAATLRELAELNVVAVGIANNHALDFGAEARERMVAALRDAGIVVLADGVPQEVGGLEFIALADFDNPPRGGSARIDRNTIDSVGDAAARASALGRPLVTLLHWGREFVSEPGAREAALAEQLAASGARWIVGAHPHVASPTLQTLADGRALLAYSLGNFVFDQRAPRASGAVLQLTCFPQGSCASRLIPMPGVFELSAR